MMANCPFVKICKNCNGYIWENQFYQYEYLLSMDLKWCYCHESELIKIDNEHNKENKTSPIHS